MKNRILLLVSMLIMSISAASAQDAKSILQAAEKAMGVANLKSLQFSGTGWNGGTGQSFSPDMDWPRFKIIGYTRTLDFEAKTSKEDITRVQLINPEDRYKPKGGGGTPIIGEQRYSLLVNGSHAWRLDGSRVTPEPAVAEIRQLDIWMTPYGFLKAAAANNAKVIKRHEYSGQKVTIVSFTALGKYRLNGTIDDQNRVIRVQTWIPNPVVGDMYYEIIYSNFKDFNGITFPTRWHHHQDHDDNGRLPNVSGGDHAFGLEAITNVLPNPPKAAVDVPADVQQAVIPPVRVESQKLADGVWFLGGGSHNSVAIEFKDYIAVVEGPLNEERSLAVIDEIYKLIPNKPIRFLVNTHHHWDHLGGMRSYIHEGATVITYSGNRAYYEELVTEKQWLLKPDRLSLYPPEEVAEGYTFETFRENYVLSDGTRNLELYVMQGLDHVAGMMIAYLPKEKLVIEADLFTPPAPNVSTPTPNDSNITFLRNVERLKLDISQIAPIHGRVVPWSDFMKVVSKGSK
ncbi:MAG: MBL fold metallo-hydrolase [Acidobacteria bacterium]|nr:MBL fold metallo-hydrolase [Acidobacteriota bacterium]